MTKTIANQSVIRTTRNMIAVPTYSIVTPIHPHHTHHELDPVQDLFC